MCNRHPQHQRDHVSSRPAPATSHRSHIALIPLEKLYSSRDNILVYYENSSSSIYHSGDPFDHDLDNPQVDKIPLLEWPTVLRRIEQGEPLRKVASGYGVSYEAVRRVIRVTRKLQTP